MKKGASILAGSALLLGRGVARAQTVGSGPNCNPSGTTNISILHTYDSMVAELKTQDAKQSAPELEVMGRSVKGSDLYLAKYLSDPGNPTILEGRKRGQPLVLGCLKTGADRFLL